MAAREQAGSVRQPPARPPPFPPRSNARRARGRTIPRTAPPLPPPRPRRSGTRGRRRRRGRRAGVGDRGTAPRDALGVGVEAPHVLAGLLQLLRVLDRAIAIDQTQ